MIRLSDYIHEFASQFEADDNSLPWKVILSIQSILTKKIQSLSSEFKVNGNIAIHKTAVVEEHVIL